ncbi:MAG: hypothetical protein A2077_03810 [Nitrospirae bacterium GWC2_46_6]|nr:MAG: hypothetical protein A2077_03810 [Nitrospirae bacterium GWC2_46_6]OGW21321.1 MAG: hypothetical protein A2Z82_01285 [Nitrospirae bacterium GWA2_46_11]OGW26102.1 MAG: hypothetical protein A2X55_03525 [Nitrospirae bacterium GWB2_47_37]HAK89443.1 hypothetical protein [Nitrospiraceae bacterium]HCL81462.1 hypothetical protein [Nitrospiraceae bacterium]
MSDNHEYKEYTPEESKIYNEAMTKIRDGMKNGLNFNEACGVVDMDAGLKKFVVDDTLKVMIAEMHYAGGMPLPQIAEALKVPLKVIDAANMEMLEDVGITAAEVYRTSNSGSPMGTA